VRVPVAIQVMATRLRPGNHEAPREGALAVGGE
jgi:hypothetical protein